MCSSFKKKQNYDINISKHATMQSLQMNIEPHGLA